MFLFSFGMVVHNAFADTVVATIDITSSNLGVNLAPQGVGVNPDTNMIYVTSKTALHQPKGLIFVINGATNSVTGNITDSSGPESVGANPTTNEIYVSNNGYATYSYQPPYNGNTVSVINGATNTVTTTINVGTNPLGVAVNPSTNKIYVSNSDSNTVSVIDSTTNTVLSTIQVGSFPLTVAVNPSTNRIYVSNYASNTVSVIDGATNTVVSTIPVGSYPSGVDVNSNTNKIYIAASGASDSVFVIDGRSSNTSTAPSAPTNLSATVVSPSQINLSWTAPTNNGGSAITGYKIERSTDGGTTWNTIVASTSHSWYSDYFLSASTTYTYRVSAINAIGTSLPSSSASATTSPATTQASISLSPTSGNAGTTVTVIGSNFTANSGITISYDGTAVATTPGTITTSSSGGFSAAFTVPTSSGGPHTVSAKDAASNSASAQFTVTTSTTSTLGVKTQDKNGNTITGFYVSLSQGGTVVASGFSPVNFTVNNGAQYSLAVADFGSYTFDHWSDTGTTTNPRPISITTDTYITAVYRIAAISLNPSSGTVGTAVTATGTSFHSSSTITIRYDGATVNTTPSVLTTNSGGNFTGSFTVPSPSSMGSHTVNATDAAAASSTAQFTVTAGPYILLNPSSGPSGTVVKVTGNNFSPNSAITIKYDTSLVNTTPAVITTDSAGSFTGTFTVPSSTTGSHTVSAADASTKSASTQFTVTTTSTLTVNTQDRVGNVITGYFISASQGGTVVASGFSPVTLTLNNNELYSLGAGSYPPYIFDHWQDTGLRDNPRFVSINANTQVAAVYRT